MDDRLNTASQFHARYLSANNTTGPFEEPGKSGFTGVEPEDRHMAFGWVGSSWEAVEFGSDNEEDAVRNLIDAPYHRIPFIQPGELWFGSGYANRRLATAFSTSTENATVVYPYNTQQDVPISWGFNERPNPLRMHGDAKRPIGYPIMLVYFTAQQAQLDVQSATLKDAQGQAVPCYLNTSQNDSELKNAVLLMPKAPLNPDSIYVARVEAAVQGGPTFVKSWTFKTVSATALRRPKN